MAQQVILPQQFGALPDILGLSPAPNVFSTTFPQPGVAAQNFLTQLPGSQAEARRKAIRTQAGGSKTMDTIGMQLILAPWDPSGYDYHNEILKGQPLFSVTSEKGVQNFTPVLNIRHVNSLLRAGYEEAMALWGDREAVLSNDGLTSTQYDILLSTPTHLWHTIDFVDALLRDKNKSMFHSLRYLWEEGIQEIFNFLGFLRNHGDQVEDLVSITISHKGFVDSVENVFGDDLMSSHSIGFILKRVIHPSTKKLGPFAFVPWYGFEYPDISEQTYTDLNGFVRYGMTIYAGTVDRWVAKHEIDPQILAESIGLLPSTATRYSLRPEPGCMRYHLRCRPGYRVPFLL